MIGTSKHGDLHQCFKLYNKMKDLRVQTGHRTFIAPLAASVNSGRVKKWWECFSEMVNSYGLQPHQEHYPCMVDLIKHYGHLDEALEELLVMKCTYLFQFSFII